MRKAHSFHIHQKSSLLSIKYSQCLNREGEISHLACLGIMALIFRRAYNYLSSQILALLEVNYTCKMIGCEVEWACVPRPTVWHFQRKQGSVIITSKRDIIADVRRVFVSNIYKFPTERLLYTLDETYQITK